MDGIKMAVETADFTLTSSRIHDRHRMAGFLEVLVANQLPFMSERLTRDSFNLSQNGGWSIDNSRLLLSG